MRKLLLYQLLILLLASCSTEMSSQLAIIESYIRERPDSAYLQLLQIQDDCIKAPDKAYHALLMSKALDLCYIDVTEDSTIMVAVDYYNDNGPEDKALQAWYYLGCIQRNANDYEHAVLSYDKACALAEKLPDYHYLGLIERNIATLYSSMYDDERALQHIKHSISAFESSGEVYYRDFSKYVEATVLVNLEKFQECDSLLTSLSQDYTEESSFSYDLDRLYGVLLLLREKPEPRRALEKFNRAGPITAEQKALVGYAYDLVNKRDSSRHYLRLAEEEAQDAVEEAKISAVLNMINASHGKYKEAYSYYDKTMKVQDSLTRVMLNKSLSSLQAEYYKNENKTNMLRSESLHYKNRLTVTLLVLAIIVILLLVLFFLHEANIHKMKLQQKEFDIVKLENEIIQGRSDIVQLKESLQEIQSRGKDSIGAIAGMMMGRIVDIETIIAQYDQLQGHTPDRKSSFDYMESLERIINDYRESIERLKGEDSYYSGLEPALNLYKDNIMRKLRNTFGSNIDEEDYKVLAFSFAGLSPKSIAFVTKLRAGTIRTKKSRYRDRFDQLPAGPDRDLFLKELTNG